MPERKKTDDFAEKAYAAAAAEMKSSGKSAGKAAKPRKSGANKASAARRPAKESPAIEDALSLPPLLSKAPGANKSVAPEKTTPLPVVETKAPPEPAPPAAAAAPAPVAPVNARTEAPVPEAPVPEATTSKLTTPEPTSPEPTTPDLKETTMASAPKSNDNVKQINDTMNNTVTTAFSEMQTRAKAAYDKGTEAAGEVTEFAKGNVEAVVESSKIFAAGIQDLGRNYVEEARAAYETMTADVKEMAAVKSPTELFQLQGKIARRNFDAMVATSSKHTEALLKLANEAFAPLSGRVNIAAEKLTKVA